MNSQLSIYFLLACELRAAPQGHMQGFKGDEELHKERAAAGVDLANTTTTPMGDDFLEQFKG